jgi:hypothetical protein
MPARAIAIPWLADLGLLFPRVRLVVPFSAKTCARKIFRDDERRRPEKEHARRSGRLGPSRVRMHR